MYLILTTSSPPNPKTCPQWTSRTRSRSMVQNSIGNMVHSRTTCIEVSIQGKYRNISSTHYSLAGMLHQRMPLVTTDPNKLEDQARSILKPTAFNYVAGGAGERSTMDSNRLAFRQWKMIPRMLRPTTHRDLRVKLFGEIYGYSTIQWAKIRD